MRWATITLSVVGSREQHVRDREADMERAKKWGLGNLRRSKGEDERAEPTFGL